MSKGTAALIMLLIALGIVAYWIASGAHAFTLTQIPVTVTDELFGTESVEWKEGFRPGLELVGPSAGLLLLGAGIFFWLGRRQKRG